MKRLFSVCLIVTLELVLTSCANDSSTSSGSSELLAAGDISECGKPYSARTAKIIDSYPNAEIATLGDNAYKDGSKGDFECYDKTWGKFKERTRPSSGNHDYRTAKAKGYFDYFGSRAGARNKGYYRYSLGDWNVIVLNSNCDHIGGCGKDSRQYRWLKKELSKRQTTCTLAYMHHPWRSSGLHGSTAQIQALGDLLFERGVDVLLSGHDHIYERFAPQRPDGSIDSQGGLRQFVIGTGGREKLYPIDNVLRNSEVRNNKSHGVLKLDLRSTSYLWKFISVGDGFTDKGTGRCG